MSNPFFIACICTFLGLLVGTVMGHRQGVVDERNRAKIITEQVNADMRAMGLCEWQKKFNCGPFAPDRP